MYRLLIADDEESIRKGVADFVRRSCPGWEIFLAEDGYHALQLAKKVVPDVVLTDITMPCMNGLDFMENLLDILPEVRLLILSGYDQFEYAVQAMRLGARDYFLKPLDTDKLVRALENCVTEMEQQTLKIPTPRPRELVSYFRSVLLQEKLPELSLPSRKHIAESGQYCCVLSDGFDSDEEALEQMLEQRFNGEIRTVLLRMGTPPRLLILIYASYMGRSNLFLTINHALTSIAGSWRRAEKPEVHFFVGGIVEELKSLELSYQQCRQLRESIFPEQAPPVMTYKDAQTSRLQGCPKLPEQMTRDILTAIKGENYSIFSEKCRALFEELEQREICDATFLRTSALSLCYHMLQSSGEDERISCGEWAGFQAKLMATDSLKELKTAVESFAELCRLHKSSQRSSRQLVAEKVKAITGENISNADFSLSDVATTLFISPNYLRQLFKQETGKTFTEFLTEQRLRYASILLENPNIKVGDVAEQAGYTDARYFSICFKKMFHRTPSEYQAMAQAKREKLLIEPEKAVFL